MARFILALLITFMAAGPVAHGYLAYKFNAIQTLLPEEETHDEKPQGKVKEDCKEQYLHIISFHQHTTDDHLKLAQLDQLIILSKGYAGTPLMPPEVN